MNKPGYPSHTDNSIQFINTNYECLSYVIERLFRPHETCSNPGGICARIENTMRFLTRNLEREENLMIKLGYGEIAAHRREHEKILDKLGKMKRSFVCGSYNNSLVSAPLIEWAHIHAETFDKSFGEFLRERETIGPDKSVTKCDRAFS